MNSYQQYIYRSRYARWNEGKKRREEWNETVQRYMDNVVGSSIDSESVYNEVREAIQNLEVMPSMRAMMTAGPALERDNTCGYNCSYLPIDDIKSFDEAMFILLCGTGVGFSVERQYVNKLPEVPDRLFDSETVIAVKDSKEGWAKALRQLISLLYSGEIPRWDTSRVRAAGTRLKTFGGRASGPEPLIELFRFIIAVFKGAIGRKLTSLECHDILCKIGEVVVVGGVRRSAMISLSNLSDDRMRHAKTGQWWIDNGQRALSNNSAVYTEKPDAETFLREWTSLVESKSGERGIFSRYASQNCTREFTPRRDSLQDFGTNPCSEIILRPYQFCNLSEVVIRPSDTLEDLKRKVGIATILGTIQSTYTHFPYLRKIWQKNTEEERLLGVSLTGIYDHPVLGRVSEETESWLAQLKQQAIDTNAEWAERLSIPVSVAITCVKPSGTVSQLVNSASGIHPRYARNYIRTVRGDNKDPLTQFLISEGVPSEPCVMRPDNTTVFSFPMRAPEEAVVTSDVSALDQLKLWLVYQENWCEHKPSVTIMVKDEEWMSVGAFVYENFDKISGVSFLPYNEHSYKQAPYQEVREEELPEEVTINWDKLKDFENGIDTTEASQEFACSSGACAI